MNEIIRCPWGDTADSLMREYHDAWQTAADVPPKTELSDRISRDMKCLGFKFVGSTIIYSYLQAVGVVNDHIAACSFK